MGVENAQVLHEGLVASCLAGLALKGANLPLHLLDDIGDTEKVRLGVLQLAERLLLLRLVLRDAGSLFEDGASVFRAAVEQLRRAPLLHDGVGAPADAGVHEEIVDVLEPAGGAVDQILRLAVTKDAAGDADFVPLDPQFLLALREGHGYLGHVVGLACVGSVENDICHLSATQSLGRLFSEHPANGIQDIRLAASVRADNCRDTSMKAQGCLGGKGLESDQFE